MRHRDVQISSFWQLRLLRRRILPSKHWGDELFDLPRRYNVVYGLLHMRLVQSILGDQCWVCSVHQLPKWKDFFFEYR